MKRISLSISMKVWLSVLVLSAGYLFSVLLVGRITDQMKADMAYINETLFPASRLSREAFAGFEKQVGYYEDAVLTGQPEMVEEAASVFQRVQQHLAAFTTLPGRSPARTSEARALLSDLKTFTADAEATYTKAATDSMDTNVMNRVSRLGETWQVLRSRLSDLAEGVTADLGHQIDTASRFYERQQNKNVAVFAFVLALSLFLFWYVIQYTIVGPSDRVVKHLQQMADEIRQASRHGTENTETLAEGATDQAAGIQQTSASIEEISGMTRRNEESARKAKEMTEQALAIVNDIDERLTDLVEAMKKISAASRETEKIIRLINDVAFQTNLLSLNAAVEAARAGDVGAGFAVVAGEVRNLAARVSAAAGETGTLIDDTISAVTRGDALANATKEMFRKNVDISGEIRHLAEDILASSREQTAGIEQISQTIARFDQVVQNNTNMAQDSAQASKTLARQADMMTRIVEELSALLHGSRRNNYRPKSRRLTNKLYGSPLIHIPQSYKEGENR
jgi:methyl-accepting chemotaxis protein